MDTNIDLDCVEPDKQNKHNYLFDTTVFNRLAENPDWILRCEQALTLGFRYYKTANQDYEMIGNGARVLTETGLPPNDYKVSESLKNKMPLFGEIKSRLKIRRVSSCAVLLPNHWILDGTYRLIDDDSPIGKTTEKIFEFDEKKRKKHPFAQYYDALSAEAALYNNCFLVSDDDNLRDLVNEDFPGKAISTKELIEIVTNTIEKGNAS